MKPEEREREQIMYKDVWDYLCSLAALLESKNQYINTFSFVCLQLYSRHKEYLNSLVGQDFEMVKDILTEETLVLLIEQFRPYGPNLKNIL